MRQPKEHPKNVPVPGQGIKSPRLSSDHLAVLIVDALVDAGFVDKKDFDNAVAVATEEIEVRKGLGDY